MPTPLIYDVTTGDTLTRPFTGSDNFLASGAVQSGALGAGAVNAVNIASGQVDYTHLAADAVRSGHIAAGAVSSGQIASGQVGSPHLAANAVLSGHIGPNAVHSGNIASGVIGTHHLASGFAVERAEYLGEDTYIAAEPISGGRCVAFDANGNLVMARANNPNRMPAIGVVLDNFTSGSVVDFIHKGRAQSIFFNFSGQLGKRLYVGVSGELTASPPTQSGNIVQRFAVANTGSGAFVAPDLDTIRIFF
ncbi:MAG: hypothetical protein QXU32_01890 [Nitrososphaerales archaeon]